MAARQVSRRTTAIVSCLLTVLICAGACGRTDPSGTAAVTTTTRPTTSTASGSASPGALSAPKTSVAQDRNYFTDVTEADPALVTYEQKEGNVALRALLTDGSAFCALLKRGGGIDEALVDEADGARSTETQTSLPLSVTTFNTIEAVALLTLCPAEQRLVPASVRARIRQLGSSLAKRSG